jgi:hypothetical protein
LQSWLNVAREADSGPWLWQGEGSELLERTPDAAASPDGYVTAVRVETAHLIRCVTTTSQVPTYRQVKYVGTFHCGTIVEGSDAEITASPVRLPCTPDDLDNTVEWVDEEAHVAWHEEEDDEDEDEEPSPVARESNQRIIDVLRDTGNAEGPDGLTDPGRSNEDRADSAGRAAQAYFEDTRNNLDDDEQFDDEADKGNDTVREVVQDLMNDLCHLLRMHKVDVERTLASAYLGFRTEEANEAEEEEDEAVIAPVPFTLNGPAPMHCLTCAVEIGVSIPAPGVCKHQKEH